MISQEIIEHFLQGSDDEKYIVSLEYDYKTGKIFKIIQDPKQGKIVKSDTFQAFAWVGNLENFNFYKKSKALQKQAISLYGISIKKLNTGGNERLENGYKYLVSSTKSYQDLLSFFKQGGIDPWSSLGKPYVLLLTPVEQYLIQKRKRLFKGLEEYSDIHRIIFDIETTSLKASEGRIFLLGIRDNRGFEEVIYASDDESERNLIIRFFEIIKEKNPTIIGGYNSAAFDFPFIVERAEILGLDMREISECIKPGEYFKSKEGVLKLGAEVEEYQQFKLWGFNIVDIAHAVRKAQAINSDIKQWSLKYITKYIEKEKPNRVYVEGNKIYSIYSNNENYYMNPKTGRYKSVHSEETKDLLERYPGKFETWDGKAIVQQYLLDDLYETDVVDESFNQSTFLLAKLVPTTYERAATMGTATLWKIIMMAWSYVNDLAIPKKANQRDFVGGLARLTRVGYSKNVVKFDFSSLYPSIQLVYDIFPDCDITGTMKSLLKYFRSTRIFYKRESERLKEIDKVLSEAYNRKQLPLKIFINAFFGSLSAPPVFPWADVNKGEQVTCTGRQALRMMIMFFMKKGFTPIITDTDGVNYTYPEETKNVIYIGKGLNELVEKDKEYKGVEAHVAEFNDTFMRREMGLDIDYYAQAQINLARKNYAILNAKGKVKLTGNSIKSKKIQDYVVEFLDKGIRMLLEGKGAEFVEYYYEYVSKIYNKEIPLAKIANKARVKQSINEYKVHIGKTTKAGNAMSRQAHMELIIRDNYPAGLGETILYVNNGNKKSHGDVINKEDKLILNCYHLLEKDIAVNPNLTGEYNVPRYLEQFNKRIEPLLICFHPDIRDSILVTDPEKRQFFTKTQCELVAGFPFNEEDQDDLEEKVLKMEEMEIEFWKKSNIDPFYLYPSDSLALIDQKWVDLHRNLIESTELKLENLPL